MKNWRILGCLLLVWGANARAEPCVQAARACTEWLKIPAGNSRLLLYRSFPLYKRNEQIAHALIVVHGALRNADNYFQSALAAAFLAGALADTQVIAPRFGAGGAAAGSDPPESGEVKWPGGDWRAGGFAASEHGLTSFDVIDGLLAALADRKVFPNLKDVVLAGHSAGGVFVHLYSISNTVHGHLPYQLTYVASNASSYAYFDETRPRESDYPTSARAPGFVPDEVYEAEVDQRYPAFDDAENCTTFNEWPFGMGHRYGYAERVPVEQMIAQAKSRRVTYLLGQLDILPIPHFPRSCPAMAQGPTRLARGEAYFKYIHERGVDHTLKIVPMCGHNERCMFTSTTSLPVLFHR